MNVADADKFLRDRRTSLEREWQACVQMNRDVLTELAAKYGNGFLQRWQRDGDLRLTSFLVAQTTFKQCKDRYEAERRAIDAQLNARGK